MENDLWKKLLEISTKIGADAEKNLTETRKSSSASNPGPSEAHPPSQESMEFLQKALSSMYVGEKPAAINLVAQLFAYEEENLTKEMKMQSIIAATDLAEKISDYLDVGNFDTQFLDDKAFKALENLAFRSEDTELRLAYLHILPSLAENRPEFQEKMARNHLFTALVESLDNYKNQRSSITSATMSAISASVRSSYTAFEAFKKLDGIRRFVEIVKNLRNDAIAAKAARILDSIYFLLDTQEKTYNPSENTEICDALCTAFYELRKRLMHLEEEGDKEDDPNMSQVKEIHELIHERVACMKMGEVTEKGVEVLAKYMNEFDEDCKDAWNRTIVKSLHVPVGKQFALVFPKSLLTKA